MARTPKKRIRLDIDKVKETFEHRTTVTGADLYESHVGGNRYQFDFNICPASDGWVQYDTDQDAWYFGVWIHPEHLLIVTFLEGDLQIVVCQDKHTYRREIERMNEFYGRAPAFVVIGEDEITEIYQDREALLG